MKPQLTVEQLFEQVGLRAAQMNSFPHQFSGGQRQRIGVARALAAKPKALSRLATRGMRLQSRAELVRYVLKQARSGRKATSA